MISSNIIAICFRATCQLPSERRPKPFIRNPPLSATEVNLGNSWSLTGCPSWLMRFFKARSQKCRPTCPRTCDFVDLLLRCRTTNWTVIHRHSGLTRPYPAYKRPSCCSHGIWRTGNASRMSGCKACSIHKYKGHLLVPRIHLIPIVGGQTYLRDYEHTNVVLMLRCTVDVSR